MKNYDAQKKHQEKENKRESSETSTDIQASFMHNQWMKPIDEANG